MKSLKLIVFFSVLFLSCTAQIDRIDTLISKIENKQLTYACTYACVFRNTGQEAEELIQLGKASYQREITNKLYQILTDTTKGIIAHYVLTNIWYANSISQSGFYYEDDEMLEYEYNWLRFYQKDGRWFTDSIELDRNKKRWFVILKPMNVIDKELATKGSIEIAN
jgi:hypothetical protein